MSWYEDEEIPAPRFKVGDKVTYKDINSLPRHEYQFSGEDQRGFVGTIISISYGYQPAFKCHKIFVTTRKNSNYTMLENEFVEYDKPKIFNAFINMLIRRRQFKKDNNGSSKYKIKART